MWMKNVNNFQIARDRPQSVAQDLLDFCVANVKACIYTGMTQQAIASEKKVDVALKNVMFPYLCFYTSNYAMFWDSEKKHDPIQRRFIREFT